MNINVIRTLPYDICIAFSGGIDSVVMAHKAMSQNKNVTLLFFNHGNDLANEEQAFAEEFAKKYSLHIIVGKCKETLVGSKEKFWRDSRYEFFRSIRSVIATGHNLDDAVEWYLLTCMRGEGHYMDYRHANVIRPLLLTAKADIVKYADGHKLEWFDDKTNLDPEFTYRNKIRHNILPACLEINPGLYTTVANNVRRRISE
jgi:tRNA(Ile)-lysidine synthase